jgi:hypothetical protein
MIKLYITAIDSKTDGTAVTLLEDTLLYTTRERLNLFPEELSVVLQNKLEEAEKINDQITSPF